MNNEKDQDLARRIGLDDLEYDPPDHTLFDDIVNDSIDCIVDVNFDSDQIDELEEIVNLHEATLSNVTTKLDKIDASITKQRYTNIYLFYSKFLLCEFWFQN